MAAESFQVVFLWVLKIIFLFFHIAKGASAVKKGLPHAARSHKNIPIRPSKKISGLVALSPMSILVIKTLYWAKIAARPLATVRHRS
jgi:hypothetical protein